MSMIALTTYSNHLSDKKGFVTVLPPCFTTSSLIPSLVDSCHVDLCECHADQQPIQQRLVWLLAVSLVATQRSQRESRCQRDLLTIPLHDFLDALGIRGSRHNLSTNDLLGTHRLTITVVPKSRCPYGTLALIGRNRDFYSEVTIVVLRDLV